MVWYDHSYDVSMCR